MQNLIMNGVISDGIAILYLACELEKAYLKVVRRECLFKEDMIKDIQFFFDELKKGYLING